MVTANKTEGGRAHVLVVGVKVAPYIFSPVVNASKIFPFPPVHLYVYFVPSAKHKQSNKMNSHVFGRFLSSQNEGRPSATKAGNGRRLRNEED